MAEWLDTASVRDLEQPGSRGGHIAGVPGVPFFLVRKNNQVYAYRNACPHTGAPLEWVPDQFLDHEGGFVQCALHGALFRVNDGFCVSGPCAGQSLQSLPVRQRDERIAVDISALRENLPAPQSEN